MALTTLLSDPVTTQPASQSSPSSSSLSSYLSSNGASMASEGSGHSVLEHDGGQSLEIAVIESTLYIHALDPLTRQKTGRLLTLYNVIIEDAVSTRSLVRYGPDFTDFDKQVKRHHRKGRIPLPTLIEPKMNKAHTRRASFRTLLSGLTRTKSNSAKLEAYLRRCALSRVVGRSSLFRDFLSAQREEDQFMRKPILPRPRSVRINHRSSIRHITSESVDASPSAIITTHRLPSKTTSSRERHIDIQPRHRSRADSSRRSSHCYSSISILSQSSHQDRGTHEQDSKQTTMVMPDDVLAEAQHMGVNHVPHPFYPAVDVATAAATSSSAVVSADQKADESSSKKLTIQDFKFLKVLGRGCMGKVLLVQRHGAAQLLALKVISKERVITRREIVHTKMERDILTKVAKIRHPFLIRLHYALQDPNQLFLLLDYHVGGDIATQLSKFYSFPRNRCLLYAAEILLGVQELHRLGILYRDLKPENILLGADGHIVLTDFGLSKLFENQQEATTKTFCGTAEYLAPEILLGQEYDFAVDYWSLGTILYEMLTGLTPFWAETHADMYLRILQDPLTFPEDMDPTTTDFIARLLERDPRQRLGCDGVGDLSEQQHRVRSHPYFSALSWADVYNKRIRPPYVPLVRSATDFSHFDNDFLQMSPRLSPVAAPQQIDEDNPSSAFLGYSYCHSSYSSSSSEVSYSSIQNLHSIEKPIFRTDSAMEPEPDHSGFYDLYTESDIPPTGDSDISNHWLDGVSPGMLLAHRYGARQINNTATPTTTI